MLRTVLAFFASHKWTTAIIAGAIIAIWMYRQYWSQFIGYFGRELWRTWRRELFSSVVLGIIYAAVRSQQASVDLAQDGEDLLLAAAITFVGWACFHALRVPALIQADVEKQKTRLQLELTQAAQATVVRETEVAALVQQLGDCQVSCEVDAVYVSQFRKYLGPLRSPGGYRLPQGNYELEAGYAHVIVDALFSNIGGLKTNIWDFNLSIAIPGARYKGIFLKDQEESWYITKHAALLADRVVPQTDYSRLSVDYEIDNDALLERGNPKHCWVHFKVLGLVPQAYENVRCVLEFRDGIRKNQHEFTANFICTTIEHRLG